MLDLIFQFSLTIIIAYLIGSIPTGYLIVKSKTGEDIRTIFLLGGSGTKDVNVVENYVYAQSLIGMEFGNDNESITMIDNAIACKKWLKKSLYVVKHGVSKNVIIRNNTINIGELLGGSYILYGQAASVPSGKYLATNPINCVAISGNVLKIGILNKANDVALFRDVQADTFIVKDNHFEISTETTSAFFFENCFSPKSFIVSGNNVVRPKAYVMDVRYQLAAKPHTSEYETSCVLTAVFNGDFMSNNREFLSTLGLDSIYEKYTFEVMTPTGLYGMEFDALHYKDSEVEKIRVVKDGTTILDDGLLPSDSQETYDNTTVYDTSICKITVRRFKTGNNLFRWIMKWKSLPAKTNIVLKKKTVIVEAQSS